MTNFEKLRENLTLEELFNLNYRRYCASCPARSVCDANDDKIDRLSCREAFIIWASAPAEEKEKE